MIVELKFWLMQSKTHSKSAHSVNIVEATCLSWNFKPTREVHRSVMIVELTFLLMQSKTLNISAHECETCGSYCNPETSNLLEKF